MILLMNTLVLQVIFTVNTHQKLREFHDVIDVTFLCL